MPADAVPPRPLPTEIRQLRWSTWRGVLRRSLIGYLQDGCTDFARAMTYSAVTAMIPSLEAPHGSLGRLLPPGQ